MNLKLEDFLYDLPEERIAKHPPKVRGKSKLLHYDSGNISHHAFDEIDKLIPPDSYLVFNDTKVIPARVIMHKETGARIEIFLLEPSKPSLVHEEVMNERKSCTWKCLIGNGKKWKIGSSLLLKTPAIEAIRVGVDQVRFNWENEWTFSDVLLEIGKMPLPPYINRDVEKEDNNRYQTVYSKRKGAVAAPTAGLHFTDQLLQDLQKQNISIDYVTLHVSAGTFQPIKTEKIDDHPMHNEQIWVTKGNIKNLLKAEKVIAVGTTSVRTLESIYWYGVKILNGRTDFFIDKNDPYQLKKVKITEALEAVLSFMCETGKNKIGGHTEIFIYPGYELQLCDGLVTNFHLPGSTLILLIATFIGEDWRKVYQQAMDNGYQFLSYGDSSLLMR